MAKTARTRRGEAAQTPAGGASPRPSTRFQPGQSGNPGGRPKGAKTYAIRSLWARAIREDPAAEDAIVRAMRAAITAEATAVQAAESAARINREIGLGADQMPGGVVIVLGGSWDGRALRGAASAAP